MYALIKKGAQPKSEACAGQIWPEAGVDEHYRRIITIVLNGRSAWPENTYPSDLRSDGSTATRPGGGEILPLSGKLRVQSWQHISLAPPAGRTNRSLP